MDTDKMIITEDSIKTDDPQISAYRDGDAWIVNMYEETTRHESRDMAVAHIETLYDYYQD